MTLNLTLGHNSSAGIFNPDGECIVAYEEERLSKVKGDSSFPKLAIEACLKYANPKDITTINISNWFNHQGDTNKYVDYRYLERRFKNADIILPNKHVTHHDMHAKSVWAFSGTNLGLTVVIDGFGNNEECISLYRNGRLIHKTQGYEHSLGLMYQYATAAAGLKENEDEYKLLGYEIDATITELMIEMPSDIGASSNQYTTDLINYNKLAMVKERWLKTFSTFEIADIAHQAQLLLEKEVIDLISDYVFVGETIQLSGGVFYNVKLNNLISRTFIDSNIYINPVCGDQGNIFGFDSAKMNSLYLGKRNIKHVHPTDNDITEILVGDMEFGPRALCHTSTLAMPTKENVEIINSYNNRNTVMPMAPVVTREFFEENFYNPNVIKSEKYMICSFDFKDIKEEWKGGAHYDPWRDTYTGRVQVLDKGDELYNYIESRGGIMINTSLNYHGTPIIYDDNDYQEYKELRDANSRSITTN